MDERRGGEEEIKERLKNNMANFVAFPDEIPTTTMTSFFPQPPSFSSSSSNIFSDMMMLPLSSDNNNDYNTSNKSSYYSSSAFMDLLNLQDYTPSLFDCLPPHLPSPASSNVPESSEVLNTTPTSPNNSSSISSSSNDTPLADDKPHTSGGNKQEPDDEDLVDHAAKPGEDDSQHLHKNNKQYDFHFPYHFSS